MSIRDLDVSKALFLPLLSATLISVGCGAGASSGGDPERPSAFDHKLGGGDDTDIDVDVDEDVDDIDDIDEVDEVDDDGDGEGGGSGRGRGHGRGGSKGKGHGGDMADAGTGDAPDAGTGDTPDAGTFDPGCTPLTCAELGAECDLIDDGCGGTLDCGACAAGEVCGLDAPNVCSPAPDTTPPPPPPPTTTISFAADVEPLLQASCVGCHQSGFGGFLLTGDAGSDHAAVSQQVIPGDPDNSRLLDKASGQGHPVAPWPAGSAARDTVSTWISEGALDN